MRCTRNDLKKKTTRVSAYKIKIYVHTWNSRLSNSLSLMALLLWITYTPCTNIRHWREPNLSVFTKLCTLYTSLYCTHVYTFKLVECMVGVGGMVTWIELTLEAAFGCEANIFTGPFQMAAAPMIGSTNCLATNQIAGTDVNRQNS